MLLPCGRSGHPLTGNSGFAEPFRTHFVSGDYFALFGVGAFVLATAVLALPTSSIVAAVIPAGRAASIEPNHSPPHRIAGASLDRYIVAIARQFLWHKEDPPALSGTSLPPALSAADLPCSREPSEILFRHKCLPCRRFNSIEFRYPHLRLVRALTYWIHET